MRGNAMTCRVHLKGKEDDYVIFAENAKMVKDWKADRSIPLAQVVSGWKIFVTHKQGSQGVLDAASKGQLESEFGTSREEDIVTKILETGTVIESESAARQGQTNISGGGTVAH